ncbi:MAG: hypothetical protein U0270_08045 [Labilithrix sp.]
MQRLGWAVAVATIMMACSSSDDSGGTSSGGATGPDPTGSTKDYVQPDANKVCTLLTCPSSSPQTTTQDECLKTYTAARIPPSCKDGLESATCDSPASVVSDCFPSCTGTESSCDGRNVTTCANGRQYTFECGGVCATQNKTWTGTCGLTYGGVTAQTVKCWCQ